MTIGCPLCAGSCPGCGGVVGARAGSLNWILCSMCHATFRHDHQPMHHGRMHPGGLTYLECTQPPPDALALVTAAIEQGSGRVLIGPGALPRDFTDLKSGVAGEFVQKVVNYQLRVAAVIPPNENHPERFRQFMVEARRHPNFRAFDDRAEAIAWLES